MSKRHSTSRSFFSLLHPFTEQLLGQSSKSSSNAKSLKDKRRSLEIIKSTTTDQLSVNEKVSSIMNIFRELGSDAKKSSLFGDVFTTAFDTLSELEEKSQANCGRVQLPISTLLVTESVDERNGFLGDNLSTLIKLVENKELKTASNFLRSWVNFFKTAVQNKFFCSFCSKFPTLERQLVRIIVESSKVDATETSVITNELLQHDLSKATPATFDEIVSRFDKKRSDKGQFIMDCCEILLKISKKENFLPQKDTIRAFVPVFSTTSDAQTLRIMSQIFFAWSKKKTQVLKTVAKQSGLFYFAEKISKNKEDSLIISPLALALKNFSNHQQFRVTLGFTVLEHIIGLIHSTDKTLVTTVCEILRNTCFVNEVEKLALEKGFVDQLLVEIIAKKDDEKLMESMMAALRNVTSLEQNQFHIGSCGGVDLILEILLKYPKNNEISEHACCSLRNLCVDCHDNRKKIHSLDGITTILNILRTLQEEKVVTEAITALWNFTFYEENCLDMLIGGIFPILKEIEARNEYKFDLDNGALRRWMPHVEKRLKKILLNEYSKLFLNSEKDSQSSFANSCTLSVDCF